MRSLINPDDRFGKLTVVRRTRPNYAWCRCDCGTELEVITGKLVSKWKKSCGCLAKETGRASAVRLNSRASAVSYAKQLDLIGKKFNKLTVLSIGTLEQREKVGLAGQRCSVQCDCGTVKSVLCRHVVSGSTKSCGCAVTNGHPAANKLNPSASGARRVFSNYRTAAVKKGLEFGLTLDYAWGLLAACCFYCGGPPANRSLPAYVSQAKGRNDDRFVYTGIDRIDNAKGYTAGNVVPCCKNCNVAKNNRSLKEFQSWLHAAALNIDKAVACIESRSTV